ncbi:MAG: hypothetical protein ETSY1_19745 [Candidatus Entotheonella factor]|uniref:Uncharacterized protein n=1 Tax=Entotheonella factor TaxID=1429438 RepID=W4LLG6_ENTF1|nr:hypothetical protein [Candidatus Entotheonella palauensis]ETW98201.1 MAG: hypothetical protein ETSY1_19745 [Candidatus Entotheonella factor]
MTNHSGRGLSKFEIAALIAFILTIMAFIWSFLTLRNDVLRRLYELYL